MNGQLAVVLVFSLGRADEPDLWSVELISQLVLGDSVDLWSVELISQLVLGRRGISAIRFLRKTHIFIFPPALRIAVRCGAWLEISARKE